MVTFDCSPIHIYSFQVGFPFVIRTLRDTIGTFATILVLLSQTFAFEVPSASQFQFPTATSSDTEPNPAKPKCTDNGNYVNNKGETVPRPENCSAAPKGALLDAGTVLTV